MARKNVASPEEKQRWLREKSFAHVDSPVACSAFTERHYSVAEIATMWNLSSDAVRKVFQNEPGVLILGELASRHKRRYTTLRIPESVLQRVHRRHSRL
jgi:hypothetical protein